MSKEILCYEKGGYRMTLAPWQGGQLIRLQKGELDLLHAPDNEDALALKPTHYGLPVLFPPNRIDAGHFAAAGREYQFPLNEPQRGNSLHGFLPSLGGRKRSRQRRSGYCGAAFYSAKHGGFLSVLSALLYNPHAIYAFRARSRTRSICT